LKNDRVKREHAEMRWLPLLIAWFLAAPGADAQDAVTTVPGSYTRQFENDWVRVVRVHYPPHARLPAHAHPTVACAYVYLNDSGPIVFKHHGDDARNATRPFTRAGAFRLAHAVEELHEVENLSAQPSDFLRIELKTDPKEPRTLRGKFYRETPPAGGTREKVQFENVQIRVTRLVIAAGQPLDVRTTSEEPALLIALTPGRIEGEPAVAAFTPGQELWMKTAASQRLHNAGAEPLEFLRFDFKTPPLAAR
jgi:hypothetical protein